jgi:hypothetical protein
MRLPSSEIVTPRVERTIRVSPSCSSSRDTALLTCDAGVLSSRAAPLTDWQRATDRKIIRSPARRSDSL